jgi:hypothetical protein
MTDRFDDFARVYEGALALPEAEREAFIRRECGGDEALAAQVRALLSFQPTKTVPPAAPARTATTPRANPARGDRYGEWQVVRPLGEDAAGAVLLAERDERGTPQRGALRLLRTTRPAADVARDLTAERRRLGRLEHPGIARLLDAGLTASGQPWLVTEYVEGRSIHEYCTARVPHLRARLELFQRVCAAVQHAHQQLVPHLAIEPERVLVTADGVPRVTAFGLARLLAEDEGAGGAILATSPDYTSPEQRRGDPASTAADVFALGVVLHELLTGARPRPGVPPSRALPRPARGEKAAAPARGLPEPPRGGGALRRALAGDLDAVVQRAIEPEPARRYGSVEEFSRDVRGYLRGYPVRARRDTPAYRASRFLRRNRWLFAAGGLAALAIFAGMAVSTWQASRAQRAAETAQRRFDDVHALTRSLVFDVDDSLATLPGSDATRAWLAQRTAIALSHLRADAEGDTALALDVARAYVRLAATQAALSRTDGADARRSFLAARQMLESAERGRPGDPAVVSALAETYNRIAVFDLAHERPGEALILQRRAVALERRLLHMAPDTARFHTGLASRLGDLAQVLRATGRPDEALAASRQAISALIALVRRSPGDRGNTIALADALTGYAGQLADARSPADTVAAVAGRSLALLEPLLAGTPDDRALQRRAAADLAILVVCAGEQPAQADSAVRMARRASELAAAVAAADTTDAAAALALADARVRLGGMLARSGRGAEARTELSPAMAWLDRRANADTSDTRALPAWVEGSEAMARVESQEARALSAKRQDARPRWREAFAQLERADSLLSRLDLAGSAWARERQRTDPLAPLREACDSALAAPAPRRR